MQFCTIAEEDLPSSSLPPPRGIALRGPFCSHLLRIGGDGSYDRQYGLVENSNEDQAFSQEVLEAAYDEYHALLAAHAQ